MPAAGRRSPAGRCGVLERLPVGAGRGVQAALGPLDLAEVLVDPGSHGGLAGRPPLSDARRQRALGLGKLAAQPLGHAQVPVGVRCQQPLALAGLGKSPAGEGDRAFGVAMERGEEGAAERDRRRHVGQVARSPADRRLERLTVRARSACQRAVGGIQRDLGRLHPVAEQSQPRLGQQQPRPRAGQPGGQRRKPPLQGRVLAAQEKRVGVPLDQPRRPGRVLGGQRVAHRVVGEALILTPGGRGPVQRHDPAGPLLLQPGAEQAGEQVMVTPPAADLIQRHQEQARPLHPLQHRPAISAAGDRITQPAGQAFQQRGFQQEAAHLLVLAVQHLLGQVVQHITVAAAERRHEPGGIGLPRQRKGGQPQAGHPPLGAGGQSRHHRGGQVSTSRLAEQRRRLLLAEPQVGGAQLGQLPASPQPGQRQRRIGPAGQHQVQARRQVLQQERQRHVHRPGVDQVIVIQDQQHLAVGPGGQVVDQRRHQPLERCQRRRPQQQAALSPTPGHARSSAATT